MPAPFAGYLSYSARDAQFLGGKVDELRSHLLDLLNMMLPYDVDLIDPRQAGDRALNDGQLGVLRKQIESSAFFIPIITSNFVHSDWCRKELETFVRHEWNRSPADSRVFPVVLGDVEWGRADDSYVMAQLRDRRWFDLRGPWRHDLRGSEPNWVLNDLALAIGHRLRSEVAFERSGESRANKSVQRDLPTVTTPEPAPASQKDEEAPSGLAKADPRVDFLIVAPPLVSAAQSFTVEFWISTAADREAMLAEATRGGLAERARRSNVALDHGAVVTATLSLPGFEVAEPVQSLGWSGDISNLGFIVRAPSSLPAGEHAGMVKVSRNGHPFAAISFNLSAVAVAGASEPPAALDDARIHYIRRAFASYAARDRSEVLRRAQGMSATGVEVFLDVMKARRGEDWERRLFGEIDHSDRLFLFWSRHAAKSTYVDREWRYALDRHGLDFIEPLPLEDPRLSAPPPELASKHFNDIYLAFIAMEEAFKARRAPR